MAKRRRRTKTFREPVPGEWERDQQSWSGLKVGLACAGVVAIVGLGWLAWLNLYAAGAAGAMIFVIAFIAQKLAERYFQDEE
jgi:hypothetical protein